MYAPELLAYPIELDLPRVCLRHAIVGLTLTLYRPRRELLNLQRQLPYPCLVRPSVLLEDHLVLLLSGRCPHPLFQLLLVPVHAILEIFRLLLRPCDLLRQHFQPLPLLRRLLLQLRHVSLRPGPVPLHHGSHVFLRLRLPSHSLQDPVGCLYVCTDNTRMFDENGRSLSVVRRRLAGGVAARGEALDFGVEGAAFRVRKDGKLVIVLIVGVSVEIFVEVVVLRLLRVVGRDVVFRVVRCGAAAAPLLNVLVRFLSTSYVLSSSNGRNRARHVDAVTMQGDSIEIFFCAVFGVLLFF
mmetsp:Transcript_17202/g.34267  ORF Transcript_17202/g.34267 Transcript_17202/m.34267 type:complete len:297 (-) Transcript_17202:82-972(-)